MSGHNKWSQIKHKKAKEDSKRGAAFTKLIKEITEAAREGGGDQDGNARLRSLLEKARMINMPAENITRAIKRGTGELPGVSYTALTYEGYGPNGMAVIVETLSDNKNRTVAELRHFFSTKGGALSATGSVIWMFEKMGVVHGSGAISEDQLMEILLDYSIHDIKIEDNQFSVFCDPKEVEPVRVALKKEGLTVEDVEFEWAPKVTVPLTGESADTAISFLSGLQDLEDVQHVYANLA